MNSTLTWRVTGQPYRSVQGHEEAVSELFALLVTLGVTDIEIASQTDAESVRIKEQGTT